MPRADNQLTGVKILFYSDDHEPVHFHVIKKGEWEIKVLFRLCTADHLEYEVTWTQKTAGPASKDLKRLREYVQEHRISLDREWETKVWQQ